jgi:hypothetical protein
VTSRRRRPTRLSIDGGTLRLRSAAKSLLVGLASSDISNFSYLYDYQNARFVLYTNMNGIGIGTTAPIDTYDGTIPSLYVPSGTICGIYGEGASGACLQSGVTSTNPNSMPCP